jgi:hypothetical protein
MSLSLFVALIENLSEDFASFALNPIDISTWLGCGTPALHAEPVELAIPWASKSSKSASLSVPGKVMFAIPGSDEFSVAPFTVISGITFPISEINLMRNLET